ncbi:Glycine cleavage system H protein, partial [Cyphomyrmex costatus]
LPDVSDRVAASSVVGELESTRAVSDLFSPVDGEVIVRNDALDGNPETINSDPYGEGWLFKVRLVTDDAGDGLLSAAEYGTLTTT